MSFQGRELHFVGIGGAGMSGIAMVARSLGASVTGSDKAETPSFERLRAAGIEPVVGHAAENVPEGAEVVVSTAIATDNPERRDPVLHRADLLGELAGLKRCIAVSGAHGKTTVTSMIAHVLRETGRRPAFIIGGELRSAGTNAEWGEGDWIVVEADESDRSFLKVRPDVAVVTNIELDHHTTYPTLRDLEVAFEQWVTPAGRRVFWEGVELSGATSTYGGDDEPPLRLQVPGWHNVVNARGAIAACAEAGVPVEEAARALASFTGAGRRFEPRGITRAGARVYDDYAHHPTEVRATLEAAREVQADGGRVVAAFQPHLYSRTKHLARDFGHALALADLVVVLDIYPARERAEDFPGVTGYAVAAAAAHAARGRPVHWLPGFDAAAALLDQELREHDVLLTIGAGDVDKLAGRLAA